MANYVNTSLHITGPVDDLNAFKAHIDIVPEYVQREIQEYNEANKDVFIKEAGGPYSPKPLTYSGFSFHSFITPPIENYEVYKGTHGFVDGQLVGREDENWYNWNTSNWGTQGDAMIGELDVYTDRTGCATSIQIRFETKWTAPTGLWQALTDKFPNLSFEVWWEEEQNYGQELTLFNGDVSVDREWDIPESHQDWENLGRTEECICQWMDETDNYFDDCPDKTYQNTDIHLWEVVVVTRYVVEAPDEHSAKVAAAAKENDWAMPEHSVVKSIDYTHREETNLLEENIRKIEE